MKRKILSLGMAVFFSLPALANPVPKRPNPTKPIINPGKIGGVDLNHVAIKKEPAHIFKTTVPSNRLNAFTLMNFKLAHDHLIERKKVEPEAYANIRHFGNTLRSENAKKWKARGILLKRLYNDDRFKYSSSLLFDRGYLGGYFYPVRPSDNIAADFEYPVVEWLFATSLDPMYLNAAYGQPDLLKFPETVFPHAGVFYPTETLGDLGKDVSGLSVEQQAHFKSGLGLLTDALRERLSGRLRSTYKFTPGEIVLTHYENLRNQAYILEGFVEGDVHVSFKALIDLDAAENSAIYAAFDSEPQGIEGDILNWMNERILQLGGDPSTAHLEPPKK